MNVAVQYFRLIKDCRRRFNKRTLCLRKKSIRRERIVVAVHLITFLIQYVHFYFEIILVIISKNLISISRQTLSNNIS